MPEPAYYGGPVYSQTYTGAVAPQAYHQSHQPYAPPQQPSYVLTPPPPPQHELRAVDTRKEHRQKYDKPSGDRNRSSDHKISPQEKRTSKNERVWSSKKPRTSEPAKNVKEDKEPEKLSKTSLEIAGMVDNFSIDFDKLPEAIDEADNLIKLQLQEIDTELRTQPNHFYKDLFKNIGFEYRRLATTAMTLKLENQDLKKQKAESQKLLNEKQTVIDGLLAVASKKNVEEDDGIGLR